MKKLVFILLITAIACQNQTQEAYILDELHLVPEGITYSNKTDKFYLTSIAQSKIISIDKKTGEQENFIEKEEYGFRPGVGTLIDNNTLYALGGYYKFKDTLMSLYAFELYTGKLLNRYFIQDTADHFLNDLIVDKKGNLYLTDSKDASVYFLEKDSTSLQLFLKSDEIQYPNGIAISDDNSKLYVATYNHGVRIIDVKTKKIINPKDTIGISKRIDGLEFYNGHLYAIQKGMGEVSNNFKKLVLSKNQTEIIAEEIIDCHKENPYLTKPLTFCIANNKAVVIANSNLEFLDQVTFEFIKSDSMKKTRLLVYNLLN